MRLSVFFIFILLFALTGAVCAQEPPKETEPPKERVLTLQGGEQEKAQEPEAEQGKDDDTISLETTVVVLNVSVRDAASKHVAGLRENDFKILEDKAPQKVTSFSMEETPLAAVVLLDVSRSMESRMSFARSACSQFAAGIREGDVVAIYSFGGTKVRKLQDFTEVRDVNPLVWETNADGLTPLYDGLVKAIEELGKRPELRRAIILVSDGSDSSSRASFDQAMKLALAQHVMIFSVNLNESAFNGGSVRDNGADIMKTLALKTGGRFIPTPGGSKLREAFAETIEDLRMLYTITYEPTNSKQDGKWRTVDVQTKQPGLVVRTRQGYYAAKRKK
jgi:VWFA-related protein